MKNTVLQGVSGRSLQTFQENLLHSHTGDQAPEGGVSSFYQNCNFYHASWYPISEDDIFFFTSLHFLKCLYMCLKLWYVIFFCCFGLYM